MDTQSENFIKISINPFAFSDIPDIVRFQHVMAVETEDQKLSTEVVTQALEHLVKNSKYGQYFIAKTDATNQPAGCTMITYAYNVLNKKIDIWYQSVYVDISFRRQNIFTRLFQHVENLAGQFNAQNFYLYVDKTNTSAQITYEKLGMHRSSKSFVEKDFYFYHKVETLDDSHLFDFEYHTISRKSNNPITIDELFETVKVYDKDDVVIHTDNNNFCWLEQSLCIKVYQKGNLVGLFIGFVEISDWSNGLNVYVFDYKLNVDSHEFVRLMKEFEICITRNNILGMRANALRFLFKHNDKRNIDLETAGYNLEHFYVYEKAAI